MTFRRADDECPYCECGTLEDNGEELACRGECGNTFPRKESFISAVLAQVEDLALEDRWTVLEHALEELTKMKFVIKKDDAENPREMYTQVGRMYCWHNRYSLGDEMPAKNGYHDPMEWHDEHVKEGDVVLPLYLFDHSGLSISTKPFSCQWDSGQVGWIVCTTDDIAKNFGLSLEAIEEAKRALEEEVKQYDHYLQGNVWGVEYHDEYCGGFYGETLEATGIQTWFENVSKEVIEKAWEERL